jgi:hypothetical protein
VDSGIEGGVGEYDLPGATAIRSMKLEVRGGLVKLERSLRLGVIRGVPFETPKSNVVAWNFFKCERGSSLVRKRITVKYVAVNH